MSPKHKLNDPQVRYQKEYSLEKNVKEEIKITLVVDNWSLYLKIVPWQFSLCQMPQYLGCLKGETCHCI